MIKGTHSVRNGAAGVGALREVKFWRFAGDVGPQEAARLTALLRLARKDESSRNNRFACVLLLAFSFPFAIVVIITIAIGHHRHRIAIAIVATMLPSYQLHYDIIIRVYYYTIVLSY